MPMNYSTARELAVLLYDEPLAKVTKLKRMPDDCYRIRFSDRRERAFWSCRRCGHWVEV